MTAISSDQVEDVRIEAMCDLQDWRDDLAEYQRLEGKLDHPPYGRIVDESYWYSHLIRQWKALRDRWGIR